MTPTEVALAFVDAINEKDMQRLSDLLTANHKFIDGDGSEHVGKDQMKEGWTEHLKLIPDLTLTISRYFEENDTVVLMEKVAEWQLFANQCALHVIYDRIITDKN